MRIRHPPRYRASIQDTDVSKIFVITLLENKVVIDGLASSDGFSLLAFQGVGSSKHSSDHIRPIVRWTLTRTGAQKVVYPRNQMGQVRVGNPILSLGQL